jgi:hypothetical protein
VPRPYNNGVLCVATNFYRSLPGASFMKTLSVLVMAMLATGALTGCGSSDSAAGPTVVTTQAKVTGLSTPKSVSVVTAN